MWQITKILLFGAFFTNILFGFAAMEFIGGDYLGIENIAQLFTLPFVTPPADTAYGTDIVVPMIPALLLLIPPLLGAIGLRLLLYLGVHHILGILTSYIQGESKPNYRKYVSAMEGIVGIGIIWSGFNLFFTSDIDYNTRYTIAGFLLTGSALIVFAAMDRMRSRVLTHMMPKDVLLRIVVIAIIGISVGGIVAVNDGIADAKKIEYLGPYTAQQIGVNRHLAELDKIKLNTHNVDLVSVQPNNIPGYVAENSDVLDVIRVWDWEAAFAKLKPEIGLIPYVDFEDNDILRFNNTLYWTASMKPVLPPSVDIGNRWYNEHLVYTHVPNGFLTLDATKGQIIDSGTFFDQRTIYYGEGGLLEETWSTYPTDRVESAELNGVFYDGLGGITLSPPLSWIFEPNFVLSFPSESVHLMRYKDITDRMSQLYPYFVYNFFGKNIDSYPVTDGEKTYWLMPLIFGTQADNVPWSSENFYIRLVGYALIDTYDGDIRLLKVGDDFFTKMFESQYGDKFEPMPKWLENQARYPVELFNWKTSMYNFYHVTDIEKYIQANEFYEIPAGLDTYYIEAKPPGFNQTEFLGLLSLELRGSQGRNLAGFMIVQNDMPNLGKMQFYEIPLNSSTKLIGPTAVREALDRDPDFAQLKTLLRNPRVGDNILYRVGDHDTYFIPVYTAGAGGVVAQLGTIAAVGAAFTGEYHVGLGDTQEEAFEAYLEKLSGVAPTASVTAGGTVFDRDERVRIVRSLFTESGLDIAEPASIQIPITFVQAEAFFYTDTQRDETEDLIDEFISDYVKPRASRVFLWETEDTLNFGTILTRDGVLEMHYIAVEVGK